MGDIMINNNDEEANKWVKKYIDIIVERFKPYMDFSKI